MKAALIEKFGALAVRDIPDPPLGDYDALCDILYGSTCAGTDSHILDGSFPWIGKLPTILGHESVGRVVQLGPKVRNYKVGDLVTRVGTPAQPGAGISVTWGGFAQRGIAKDHWAMAADGLPQNQWTHFRVNQLLPAGIPAQTAPMFVTWRETLSYLQRRGFRSGMSLLVLGSGGNGLSFAAHAANIGASFIAMTGSERLAAAAKELGVHQYLDYKLPNLTAALRDSLPAGFDFIIDAVGQKGMADTALPSLKPGGHLAIYGMDDFKNAPVNFTLARGPFTIHGPADYDEAETHAQICDYVLRGKLKPTTWYNPETPYPLAEINQAYAAVRARKHLKALIALAP